MSTTKPLRGLALLALLTGSSVLGPPTAPSSGDDAQALVIRMRPPRRGPDPAPPGNDYKTQLIELILNRTRDTHGSFHIQTVPTAAQVRSLHLLEEDKVNVVITMTSRDREKQFLPIRIPVYKGLYGWRLPVIRREDRARFEKVETLEQLRGLWAGQGRGWPDTEILEANGLPVETAAVWPALYRMLSAGRIDYFPRGVHEPFLELEELGEEGRSLIVEEHLALHYPAPGYIFVARHNRALAKRLEKGLRAALADGSFDRFFEEHPDVRAALQGARLEGRRVLRLQNPLLSPDTPLDQRRLWLQPGAAGWMAPGDGPPR